VRVRKVLYLCVLLALAINPISVSVAAVATATPRVTTLMVDSLAISMLQNSSAAAGYCQITVKTPVRSGSYVIGEASVTCSANANIDLKVTLAGPNRRTASKTCTAVKYCSLRVSGPYTKGAWRTEADGYAWVNALPWHDYKVSPWINL
jgi:hypothetical protein